MLLRVFVREMVQRLNHFSVIVLDVCFHVCSIDDRVGVDGWGNDNIMVNQLLLHDSPIDEEHKGVATLLLKLAFTIVGKSWNAN
jgi:hypothetical protein